MRTRRIVPLVLLVASAGATAHASRSHAPPNVARSGSVHAIVLEAGSEPAGRGAELGRLTVAAGLAAIEGAGLDVSVLDESRVVRLGSLPPPTTSGSVDERSDAAAARLLERARRRLGILASEEPTLAPLQALSHTAAVTRSTAGAHPSVWLSERLPTTCGTASTPDVEVALCLGLHGVDLRGSVALASPAVPDGVRRLARLAGAEVRAAAPPDAPPGQP